jgi:hypothetical protein
VLTAAWAIPGRAELPPQYTTWEDFGAVAREASIPGLLGVVDRIECTDAGRYIVRAGACRVEVSITRESARGPDGQAVAGPSHITGVKVGERRCN